MDLNVENNGYITFCVNVFLLLRHLTVWKCQFNVEMKHVAVHVPGPPLNLRVEVLSPTAMKITWDPPAKTTGYITKYKLVYFEEGTEGPGEHDVEVNGHSHVLTALKIFKQYSFRVSGGRVRGKWVRLGGMRDEGGMVRWGGWEGGRVRGGRVRGGVGWEGIWWKRGRVRGGRVRWGRVSGARVRGGWVRGKWVRLGGVREEGGRVRWGGWEGVGWEGVWWEGIGWKRGRVRGGRVRGG